jgi:hypothetical protein
LLDPGLKRCHSGGGHAHCRSGGCPGNTGCTSTSFGGDPIPGESKACYTTDGSPPGYSTSYAGEGTTCGFTGARTVAYGARGAFVYRSFTGGTPCTTAAFGTDPLTGIAKSCYLTP